MTRPGPLQWIRYAFGAALPPQYWDWVFADTTGPTWGFRHLLRALLQMTPIALPLLVFVPGPFWIRGLAVLGGVLMGVLFSLAYMDETTEHRLVKAGFPAGTGHAERERRTTEARAIATARRREKIAARHR